jgi:hypothetical protein
MNGDQVGGLARALLTFGSGILISKGIVDAGTAGTIVGAFVTIATAVWSLWANRPGAVIAGK